VKRYLKVIRVCQNKCGHWLKILAYFLLFLTGTSVAVVCKFLEKMEGNKYLDICFRN